jgi:hypothetical protein
MDEFKKSKAFEKNVHKELHRLANVYMYSVFLCGYGSGVRARRFFRQVGPIHNA